jgi:hypothetical protein
MTQMAAVPPIVGDPSTNVTDFIYKVTVITLAVVAIAGLVGIVLLSVAGKSVPEGIVALASAAVGAMAGLLAPSPTVPPAGASPR